MKTISFYGTCPARGRVTLVSGRIRHAFTLRRIMAFFPAGCMNLMQLSFYSTLGQDAPSTEAPSEASVLAENAQVGYVVGEDQVKDLYHDVEVSSRGSYLKVHAYNQDYYDHAVDVQMFIEAAG